MASSEDQKMLDLLRQIGPQMDYSGSTRSIDPKLLLEYNQAAESAYRRCNVPPKCGLSDLPVEIWLGIVREATSSKVADIQRQFDANNQQLLILTQVNKSLATPILHTPWLWSNIVVNDHIEDLEAKLSIFLHLSGESSLSLAYDHSAASVRVTAPLLAPHLHRVNALFITLFFLFSQNSDQFLSTTSFSSVRHLETSIHYFHQIPQLDALAPHQPALSSILPNRTDTIGYIKLLMEDGQLTEVDLPLVSHEKLQVLERIDSVRALKLESDPRSDTFHSQYSPDGQHVGDSDVQHTPLHWTILCCKHMRWDIVHNLLNRSATTLTDLEVDINVDLVSSLLPQLNTMINLKRLNVTIVMKPNQVYISPKFDLASKNATLPLKRFIFRVRTSDDTDMTGATFSPSPVSDAYAGLVETFCKNAPLLETVEVPCFANNFTLSDQLTCLTSLYLQMGVFPVLDDQTYCLAPLHLRRLFFFGGSSVFNQFRSRSVHHLTYKDPDGDDYAREPLNIFRINTSQEAWPELMHLEVSMNHHQLRFKPTSSLRKLSVSRIAVVSACYQMALEPDLFPSLQIITMSGYVEWDILCIMLERRLVARSHGIQPLHMIQLGYTPPDLRYFICSILRGHLVERRSNYDLSFQHVFETLKKKNVTGCLHCHVQLRWCSDPATDLDTPIFVSSYPTSVDKVLATWDQRYIVVSDAISRARFSFHSMKKEFVVLTAEDIESESQTEW